MKNQKWKAPNEPQDFNKGKAWYYVNAGSVDVTEGNVVMRLPRKTLQDMLSKLKPLPKAK